MFHSGTQTLIDAWCALPRALRIPARAQFDPLALAGRVPHLFAADRGTWTMRVRLAGERVQKLHGSPLAGIDWLNLWHGDSRQVVVQAVSQSVDEARPVILSAGAPGLLGSLEIVLVPFRRRDGTADQIIGHYQLLEPQDILGESIGLLMAHRALSAGIRGRAPLALAAVDGRRIA